MSQIQITELLSHWPAVFSRDAEQDFVEDTDLITGLVGHDDGTLPSFWVG